ncbi:thy-1 membrane glycoprotein isoform X2 [Hippopotamus amphibius kiboko]|nr:thy-1 membrane glycoprotein isoform X2 [Hippopotamus amphibius kiboko]
MNPTIGIALLLTVLQVARGQKVTSLTACLMNQSLRLDCHHENSTNLPIQYEFSLTRETKKHVLFGTIGVPEHAYRSRTNFYSKYNLKVLHLSGFTTKDEGIYTCELQLSGQTPTTSNKNVSVFRGRHEPPHPRFSGDDTCSKAREPANGKDGWCCETRLALVAAKTSWRQPPRGKAPLLWAWA